MLAPEARALRFRLHREGLTDRQIAERLGATRNAVKIWRVANRLPPNGPGNRCAVLMAERMTLYQRGMSDHGIAKLQNVHHSSVWLWRRRQGLPNTYSPPDWRKPVRELYDTGASDRRISRLMYRNAGFGRYWRIKMGLPRNFEPLFQHRHRDNRVRPQSNTIRIASVGDVSLDAPNSFGRTWIDNLRDDSWSDWLEEMGATVW